jgi:hypothetical protein
MRVNCASCGANVDGSRRSSRDEDGLCAACRAMALQVETEPAPISLRDVDLVPAADLEWSDGPLSARSSGSAAADFSHRDLDALAAICPPQAAQSEPPRSTPPRRQDGRIDFEAIFGTDASRSSLPLTPRAPDVEGVPSRSREVASHAKPPPPPTRASIPDIAFDDSATRSASVEAEDEGRLASPPELIEDEEDRGPSSGLRDLRRMSAVPPPPDSRLDRDLIYLSGGLFDGSTALPAPTILPLDLTVPAPPPSARRRALAEAGSMAPTAVTRAPEERRSNAPPVVAPANAPRSATGKRGMLIAGLAAAALALIVVGKLGVIPRASATAPHLEPAVVGLEERATPTAEAKPEVSAAPSASTEPSATAATSTSAAPISNSASPVAATNPLATGKVDLGAPSAPAVIATTATSPTTTFAPPPNEPKPAVVAPSSTPEPEAPSAPEFDPDAAKRALAQGAANAHGCRGPDDPSGVARLTIIFAPSGRVTSARIAGPPFQGTPAGSCIAQRFQGLRIAKFAGSAVSITKEVTIE